MAFGSTISLTIDSTAYTLNRVNQDNYGSEYQYSGSSRGIVLKIRHTSDSPDKDGVIMKRHNIYVEETVYATASTDEVKHSATFTFRETSKSDPALSADFAGALQAYIVTAVLTDLSVGLN
jgi:hypothetical protein